MDLLVLGRDISDNTAHRDVDQINDLLTLALKKSPAGIFDCFYKYDYFRAKMLRRQQARRNSLDARERKIKARIIYYRSDEGGATR